MRIREIVNELNKILPIKYQDSWDNSGFQIGDLDNEITNILVTLELTEEAIDFAILNNCNLILNHHPIMFFGVKQIADDVKSKKIKKLIRNNISNYASHTSADVNGFNNFIFEKLGFKSEGKIIEGQDGTGTGDYQNINITFEELVEKIKTNLPVEHIIVHGNQKKFKKIGLITGSGMDLISDVIKKKIDCFITGDVTHHFAMDAIEMGITVLDIGHEASERLFNEYFREILIKEINISPEKIFLYQNEDKYLKKVY